MQMTRTLAAAFIVTAIAVVGGNTTNAQSVTKSAGVTVVRGMDGSGAQAPNARSSQAGVSIYRGTSPAPARAEPTQAAAPPAYIQGGENLWIVDPENDNISACSLRYDIYGNRNVRCSSDRYR